ncbi:MAG: sigma-70 family RNA polymerase sigma factor [Candidatus Eisenbacteria bacterium]|uniref:Sigma-70 family RNA polymerase sigma factor n=1 Tax=Eiseniibacteriota bacterium TaxID=2212470 RepID=A0A956LY35_UNCEI|nr:sigma-70 family RNA polymerase sigma factor [Candidatus Eisenbacteria bacterium]
MRDQSMDIEKLYEKYGPMVLRRCRQILSDEEDAMDATQDVFVRLCQAGGRVEIDHPSSFLFVAATNECLNRLRSRSRRGPSDGDPLLLRIATMDDTEDRVGALSTLRRLFAQNPPSTRTMAVLHYVDGMTLEETAKETGMSVSGVRKRLRALHNSLTRIVSV